MLLISRLLVGLLLLFLGRRLYWLFVAGIGFVCGLELAPRLWPQQSETVIVIAALGLALVGALVAVVAAKVVLGLIGFAAGCGTAALLLPDLGANNGVLAVAIYLIAGVVGAVLLVILFDWALIALSSLAGAGLVSASAEQMVQMPPAAATALVIALAVVGFLVQARLWPARRPSR
jgi:hypothetical protein